jgi:hypothetical protein
MDQALVDSKPKGGNRGGRPRKQVRQDEQLALMCTHAERTLIELKAAQAGLTISGYLRSRALTGEVVSRKTLPMEVLQLSGTLNHLAANLNQIAKKRNSFEQLDEEQRAQLNQQSSELKALAEQIKRYLK